ncbi:MMPL family transporter [Paraflavisolibacter sp. H34]|uniref:efflux RND transporter permease subunit n=1 Tax=Huijunlia imazamoxiresistens TaxID=3127457 RepID=UPI00301A6DDB
MWKTLGKSVLRYRVWLLALLLVATAFMGWKASQVKLSYEFAGAIPRDNPKYLAYQEFRKKFGEDGNLLVIGVQTKDIFRQDLFNAYTQLHHDLKQLPGVDDVLAMPAAINLTKNYETEKLQAVPIFPKGPLSQAQIDSGKATFLNLPFYRGLLYNPQSGAWLMGVRINREILNSAKRTGVVNDITRLTDAFGAKHQLNLHLSGLPLIRTVMATRVSNEARWFTGMSILLSAVILLLFFRSVSATLLSLAVVIIGVIWSFGTVELMGYKITLLTALISPLVVVIGIPNCIYFLNKYHTAYNETGDKREAIVQMIAKMGVVTLFCNIAAAIGFAVFGLTESAVLKEFGVVAGINIMMLFFISLVLIPAVLSMLPAPKPRHVKYLHNPRLQRWLARLERWALNHRKAIYVVTAAVLVVALAGIFQLKSVGYIVDDLPRTDKIYTDLKFFEKNFEGVMPLEILVDTKKKYGVTRNLGNLQRIDSLAQFLEAQPYIGKPLSLTEGLKFAKQAFFEGDSTNYSMPAEYDLPALAQYLNMRPGASGTAAGSTNSFTKLVATFMDSNRQQARISVNMQDIGSARLPFVLDSIQQRADALFDKDKYNVQLTGTSVTFLEGTRFIINGLRESIFWAFLLIALCMLYLFRSLRILLCSLIPNIIPLVITAGVMGWAGVPLKPSTVLVFSVALGIAIDITIRFLVNYKQDSKKAAQDPAGMVIKTIHSTGLSIIYTSIVLVAGFVIFCFSGFGGTQALGWLTSLTLVTATITNLVFLPALLISLTKKAKMKKTVEQV